MLQHCINLGNIAKEECTAH
ncbi:hypothetical protein HU200_055453 [Digitaria exilis]|uniref:Uncharacterized protein n=1 Tax=Digitaria exilis TaxID=1010633 RepID=A0A835AI43_9POAL|nr:hypothetical protein HU200_055453 [Digitaria exilis]